MRGLVCWGTQGRANNADSTPIMTQQQSAEETARAPVERMRAERGGGSIALVLLVALVLVAAAGGLLFMDRAKSEPYVLVLLAALSMVGVFLLLACAPLLFSLPTAWFRATRGAATFCAGCSDAPHATGGCWA